MKPSGALLLVCRGLRCRALTPAHGFGWREHKGGVPESKCRLGECRHILSVTRVEPFSGTGDARASEGFPMTTARPILSLIQLTASISAT